MSEENPDEEASESGQDHETKKLPEMKGGNINGASKVSYGFLITEGLLALTFWMLQEFLHSDLCLFIAITLTLAAVAHGASIKYPHLMPDESFISLLEEFTDS
jgi:hypothetical protein